MLTNNQNKNICGPVNVWEKKIESILQSLYIIDKISKRYIHSRRQLYGSLERNV